MAARIPNDLSLEEIISSDAWNQTKADGLEVDRMPGIVSLADGADSHCRKKEEKALQN